MNDNKPILITTLELYGRSIPVFADRNGRFHANDDEEGETHSSDVLATLREKFDRILVARDKTPELAIPVTILNDDWLEGDLNGPPATHATLRGAHASQRNTYLLIDESGKKFKVQLWGSDRSKICRRLSPADFAELVRLRTALDAAKDEYGEFQDRIRVHPEQLIADARVASLA